MDRLCQCPLCFEVYETARKPKVLPCGHTLCELCIAELRHPLCSECGHEFVSSEAESMPTNFALLRENESKMRLREQGEALMYAIHCNICESGIKDTRYVCLQCPNFDLCQDCFTHNRHRLPGHRLLHNPHKENPSCVFPSLPCSTCQGPISPQAYRCLKCLYYQCPSCHHEHSHPHPMEVLTNDVIS